MSLKNVADRFNRLVDEERANLSQYIVTKSGIGGVLDVTFRTEEVVPQLIIGLNQMLKNRGLDNLPAIADTVVHSVLKKIMTDLIIDVKKNTTQEPILNSCVNISQNAKNRAAISGPMTKPVIPNKLSPPNVENNTT